jgi:hypothetical protein
VYEPRWLRIRFVSQVKSRFCLLLLLLLLWLLLAASLLPLGWLLWLRLLLGWLLNLCQPQQHSSTLRRTRCLLRRMFRPFCWLCAAPWLP